MTVAQPLDPGVGASDIGGLAEDLARASLALARRFAAGGTMWCASPTWPFHAHHVAVEFVHPVIVGKRALPAISLTNDAATVTGIARRDGFSEVFAHQIASLADPDDVALGVSTDGRCPSVLRGLEVAKERGLLTIALAGGDGGAMAGSTAADHVIVARSDDPRIVKEVHVTAYHILWELVHVFLEQPGVLGPEVLR